VALAVTGCIFSISIFRITVTTVPGLSERSSAYPWLERYCDTFARGVPGGTLFSSISWMGFSAGSSVFSIFWQPLPPPTTSATSSKTRIPEVLFKAISVSDCLRFSKRGTLLNDLEAVFFNHRICQHFFGDSFDLLLRFFARQPVQVQHKKLSLANFAHLRKTKANERVVNRFPLRIEHGAFWHYPNVSFHTGKYINSNAQVHAG